MRNVKKHFPIAEGIVFKRQTGAVRAVDGVDLEITRGETLGLIGESGCGKSTLARLILGLIPVTSGTISYDGDEVQDLDSRGMNRYRRKMQIIFQDPYSSLDPRMSVLRTVSEPMRVHTRLKRTERSRRVGELLEVVGLDPDYATRFPHEFSGGQRQRIGIARALALDPEVIICDEPVSALDVSIQAQILNLLKRMQREFHLTYLFISHDMSVVRHVSDRVAVMYLGRIMEMAPKKELFTNSQHPYTQALLSAIPVPDPARERTRIVLQGDVPSPIDPPAGCSFHKRCPLAIDRCSHEVPPLRLTADDHYAACHLIDAVREKP
jgi:oligopeptide/dipeptide ABC transporter ATP-binding protein